MTDTAVVMPRSVRSSASLIPVSLNAPIQERLAALEEEAEKLSLMLEMSGHLSTQKELDRVMALVIEHTTRIMACDRSSVLLLDSERGELYSLVAQGLDVNESMRFSVKSGIAGLAARLGEMVNIPDAYQDSHFNSSFDKASGYRTVSVLCAPMRDRRGHTVGIIQCLNKKGSGGKVTVFGRKDETVLAAVASQAAIFLENAALIRQMDRIFEAFVEAMSRSIDDRDPCTSGHSHRVTVYSMNLARAVHDCQEAPFDKIKYTRERMRQMRYACLLHDIGKIGVREHILCKATKLTPMNIELIRQRFETMRELARAEILESCLKRKAKPARLMASRHHPLCAKIDQALKLIENINIANMLPPAEKKALKAMLKSGWITREEFKHLSVNRGNLTEAELEDMRSHVTKSWLMLRQIPWPQELQDLPEVAYTHHEKRDGSGYPRRLKSGEINFDGQIMCVADIYDALTATDRPYRRAITHDLAKRILTEDEAANGKMLPELVKLFFDKECYKQGLNPTSSRILSAT